MPSIAIQSWVGYWYAVGAAEVMRSKNSGVRAEAGARTREQETTMRSKHVRAA